MGNKKYRLTFPDYEDADYSRVMEMQAKVANLGANLIQTVAEEEDNEATILYTASDDVVAKINTVIEAVGMGWENEEV
jgi:hypothetical protein